MAEKDDLMNNWGCELISVHTSSRQDSFSAVSLGALEGAVKRSMLEKFKFHSLHACGSSANHCAVDLATNGDISRCLVAIGSYAAGNGGTLEYLSTSKYSKCKGLSIIKSPYDESVSDKCKAQTVILPYHVANDRLSEENLAKFENKCIQDLERTLLLGILSGKMYKALLLELLLSGCGGELSESFLSQLGKVLYHYGVTVVVDEILTGGRVGPGMAMTISTPPDFQVAVSYITFGKCIGVGMVLEKSSSKPLARDSFRVTSTNIPYGKAYSKWKAIQNRLDCGMIDIRRQQATELYHLKESETWGTGCLLFMGLARTGVTTGLPCRLLPKLENVCMHKMTATKSIYTRQSVCDLLMSAANEWLDYRKKMYKEKYSPFLLSLVEFIMSLDLFKNVNNRGFLEVVPDDFLKFLGGDDEVKMKDQEWRALKRLKNSNLGKTATLKKEPKNIVMSSLKEIARTAVEGSFVHTRIGSRKKRLTGYRIFLSPSST